MPTNQALLAYTGQSRTSASEGSSLCTIHGKPVEAYAPDTFTLLCIECMLSKQFKHKNAKSVADGYREALESISKDERLCGELVARGQTWIGDMTTARLQVDRDRENELEKIQSFFAEIEGLVSDLKEQSLTRLDEECTTRKMKIDSAVQEVRTKMEEASEIGQDKFLDKIEMLSRVKHRKAVLDGVKKCMGTLPVKGLIESYHFNSKVELDNLATKIRLLYEESGRPSTASQKNKKQSGKNSNASSRGLNGGVIHPNNQLGGYNSGQAPKLNKKSHTENQMTTADIYIEPPTMPNNSRNKAPAQPVMANNSIAIQGHASLAEKRKEMKLQKHNNLGKPIPSNQGTRPSSQHGQPKGALNSNTGSKGAATPKEASRKVTSPVSNGLMVQGKQSTSGQPAKPTGMDYRDISKMTIKELDDQKISVLSDTCFDHGGITFNQGTQPFSYDRQRDSEGKDESYHLTNYLETLQDQSKNQGMLGATGDQKELQALYQAQLGEGYKIGANAWNKNGPGVRIGAPVPPVQPRLDKDFEPIYQSVFNENANYNDKDKTDSGHYRLVCMGGINAEGKMTVELYDSLKQSWITVERLAQTRINFGLISLSEHSLLVFGGVSPQGQPIRDSSSFSMITLSFSPHKFRLSSNKFSYGYASRSNLLYLAGGMDVTTGGTLSETEVYNLNTGVATRLASMRQPRSECCLVYCSTMNSLIAVGGKGEDGASLKDCERFNLSSGKWEDMPEMLIARRLTTAESINGCVYVAGGYDGEKPLCSVEKYAFVVIQV